MNDLLYRRSMGYAVDSTNAMREVSQGVSGYTEASWDELHPYSLDGSDLMIAPEKDLVVEIEEYLEYLADKQQRGVLHMEDIDLAMIEDAARMKNELQRQLDALSAQDKLYAHAVQDWAIEELGKREEARGESYPHASNESYLETVAVLDSLIIELVTDDEDEKLIELAKVWRKETLAELRHARLQEYYHLAA